jgi:hypothetical protein
MNDQEHREAELTLKREMWAAERDLNLKRVDAEVKNAWIGLGKFAVTTLIAAAGAVGTFIFMDRETHQQKIAAAKWDRGQVLLLRYIDVTKEHPEAGERLLGYMCELAGKDTDQALKEWSCAEKQHFKEWADSVRRARESQAGKQQVELALSQVPKTKGAQAPEQIAKLTNELAESRKALVAAKRDVDAARQKVVVSPKPAAGSPQLAKLHFTGTSVFRDNFCIVSASDSVNYCFYPTAELCASQLRKNKETYPESTKDDRCMPRPVPLQCYLWKHVSGSVLQSCSTTRVACESSRTFSLTYSEATQVDPACEAWTPPPGA